MSQPPPPGGHQPSQFDPLLGIIALGVMLVLGVLFACLVL